jgi:hypothetical protein
MSGDEHTFNKGTKILTPENELEYEFQKMHLEKDIEKANQLFLEAEKQKQAELEAKLATLEMIPLYNKVLILPYPRNPYKKIVNESGLIVEYNGSFKNPDTGEMDTMKELIGCAKVIETGPECKYLKQGDDIFYDTRSALPVPMMSLGYLLIHEAQALCALNENLTERFRME